MVDKLYIIRPVVKLDNFKLRQEYRKLQGKKYDVKAVWDDIYLNYPEVEAEIERAQKEEYKRQQEEGFTGSFEDFLENAKNQGIDRKHKWLANSKEVFNKALEIWDDSDDYVIDNGIQMSFKEFRQSKKGDARFYTKIINDNTRDGRNNIIFDTIYAMLTSEQAMDQIFTPGNFDEPKQYGYMAEALRLHPEMSYEEVQKKFKEEGVDGLKDLIAKSKNLVYNNIHLAFHKQNMVAGKLIGIFAQNNVSHSIVSLIDQSIKTDADGNTLYDVNGKPKLWRPTIWIEQPVLEIEGDIIGGREISFDALEDKKGRRISNTLAAFLAASVDAVKDPVLNFMNINETTAGILTSLVRMGYDTELAMLFLTQPVIKDVIVKYAIENEEGYKSLDQLIQETIDTLNENGIDISNLTIPSLSKKSLIKTLRSATPEENINLLRALQELNNISRVTSAIVSITKFNSVTAAAGPMLSNTMLMKQRVYQNLQMEELQTESMRHALNNPIIRAFRETEFEAVDKLFKNMMLQANPQFDRIVTRVQEAVNGKMDDTMVNKLSDFYLAFMLARGENPIFRTEDNDNPISENRRKYIYKALPWEIRKLQKSSDNRFLKLLRVMPKDEAHEYYWLKINTRGMNGSVHDDVGLYWQELYQENPDIAMALIEYNFVTSGLGFTPNSFANLIPIALKRIIPNYIQLLSDPDSILNTEEEDRLIDQFIRNNHSNSKVVKKVSKIKKGSISFGNGYILISDNIANIRKDENNFYEYISYGGKLYKNKGVKADKVKYLETSKLGGKYGEVLEINPNGEVDPIDLKTKKNAKKASEEKKDNKKRVDYSEDELFDDMVDDSKKKKSSISDAMIAQIQWFILNRVPESEQKDRIKRLRGALAARKTDKKAPENALRALFSKYSEEGYSQSAFSRMTDIGNIVYNAIQGLDNISQTELNSKIKDILDTQNDLNICE